MNIRRFFVGRTVVFLILLAVVGVWYVVDSTFIKPAPGVPVAEEGPTFRWEYRPYEKEGIPFTAISLYAYYPDETVVIKDIEDIDGQCNEYEGEDTDVYERSTMTLCYYAGLGRYYKVVEVDGKYAVQRKIFEEAFPGYNPPAEQYETIVWLE